MLHQLHPAADGRSGPTVVQGVRRYRDRLARVCPTPSDFDQPVEGLDDLRLFAPRVAALAGGYDFATLYLSDDVACIDQLAAQHGAVAQETLFGPLRADLADTERRLLRRLLGPGDADTPPIGLLVASLKIGDHLLALDAEAVVDALRTDILARSGATLDLLVLRCWSWPDVVVLATSPDLSELLALASHIEHRPLSDLLGNTNLDSVLATARDTKLPKALLTTWVHGREHDGDLDHDSFGKRDLAVVERCQLGLLPGGGAPTAGAWAIQDAAVRHEAGDTTTRSVLAWSPGSGLPPDAPGDTTPLIARVRLGAKPGHEGDVARHADALRRAWPLQVPAPSLHRGRDGQHTTLSLDLPIPPTIDGFAEVLAAGLWLRAPERAGPHLFDVSTALLDPPPLRAPPHDGHGAGGYGLLDATWGTEHVAWFHERAGTARLGATSARSLHNLLGTVRASAGRPDMFGAMLDLVDLRRYILHRLAGDDLPWPELARDVDDWVAFGTMAWHQRIEQSTALLGGPRLQGQLPYGITQLVTMLGGLVGALHGLVDHALPDRPPRFDAGRHRPALVVLTPDDAVQVKLAGGVPIFRVGAAAATSVPHLGLLFHELGHILFRRLVEGEEHAVDQEIRVLARHAVGERQRRAPPHLPSPRPERLLARFSAFIGDVLANATWRRLGCESLDRFERQFLLAQAMGMREDNLRECRAQATEAWAEALIHLRLQQELAARREHLGRALRATCAAIADPEGWQAWVAAHRTAWTAELTQPDPGEPAPPTVDAVAQELAVQAADHMALLAPWSSNNCAKAEAVRARCRRLFNALASLEDVLTQAEDKLADSGYAALATDIAAGRSGPTPPWSVVDPDRDTPATHAFLWARRVLGSAVYALAGPDTRPEGADLGIHRDAANHSRGPDGGHVLQPGTWADHRGRLFVVGRVARARHVQVQAAALTALGALGWRVRAGSLLRFLRHARLFPRTTLPEGSRARLRSGDRIWTVPVRDSSPVSVGCNGPPPAPGPIELAVPLTPTQAEEQSVRARVDADGAAAVLWIPVQLVGHRRADRFGLKLPNSDLLRDRPRVFSNPTWPVTAVTDPPPPPQPATP